MAKNEVIASVLSFEKKLVPSDGYLYGTTWTERYHQCQPLKLIEKSVRGTIANRLKDALKNDPMKLNAEVEKANLQKVDHCSLEEHQDTLKLHFTLKFLSGVETPSTCNNLSFKESYLQVAKNYIEQEGFHELAKRYATNIANGRYLWRNRVGAEKIEIVVNKIEYDEQGKLKPILENWTFDGAEYSLKDFNATDDKLMTLATYIADTLSGKSPYLLLEINAYALVGKAQEIYPSQELVLDKGKGDKSKILYEVNHVAAMHSQKIGNALRTIDTWYPASDESTITPIAIEPYGAVTTLGRAYRTPIDKADFYTLFDKYALGKPLANKEQEHYVMAVLVRGGVFGQKSDKKDKATSE